MLKRAFYSRQAIAEKTGLPLATALRILGSEKAIEVDRLVPLEGSWRTNLWPTYGRLVAVIAAPIMYSPHPMKKAPLPCAITSSHVGPLSVVWTRR